MNAILRVYPESGQSVIMLCNLDRSTAYGNVGELIPFPVDYIVDSDNCADVDLEVNNRP